MAESGDKTTIGTGSKFTLGSLVIILGFSLWNAREVGSLRIEVQESYPQKAIVDSQFKLLETQQTASRDLLRAEIQGLREQITRVQADLARVEAKIP